MLASEACHIIRLFLAISVTQFFKEVLFADVRI